MPRLAKVLNLLGWIFVHQIGLLLALILFAAFTNPVLFIVSLALIPLSGIVLILGLLLITLVRVIDPLFDLPTVKLNKRSKK